MPFGKAISTCFAKFVRFSGRASRSEYWWFQLFFLISGGVAFGADLLLGTVITDENDEFAGGLILWLVILILVLPQSSVLIRRLHDTNHSGWWYWLQFVPLVGPLVTLVWACTPGTTGDNAYGQDPLSEVASVFD